MQKSVQTQPTALGTDPFLTSVEDTSGEFGDDSELRGFLVFGSMTERLLSHPAISSPLFLKVLLR